MGSFFTSPVLMAIGAALVALPIIIHILNRRRFKRLDWAAMDFLLEANRINRKRIQLQDLLLLLMRCLAVILIGAFVARPFITQDSGGTLRSGRFERVVILDDSPSMDSVDQGQTPFEKAKEQLEAMMKTLAENTTEDTLTLYLASAPDVPVISGEAIDPESLATRLDAIRALQVSDVPADYRRALESVERSVARAKQEQNNQILYLLTDLRELEWAAAIKEGGSSEGSGAGGTEEGTGDETGGATGGEAEGQGNLVADLKGLAPQVSAAYVVDAEPGDSANILIESVVSEEAMVIAGVTSRFIVTVRNSGKSEVRELKLSFKAGRSLPVEEDVEPIPAGGSVDVTVIYTFTAEERDELTDERVPDRGIPVIVSIATLDRTGTDVLEVDNTFFFPARVSSGIRTLIVDGDPSSIRGRSESYYLKKALSPRGRVLSGVSPDVVTEGEFDSTKLSDYQVIFLLNVYEVKPKTVESLEKWVEQGGGLGIALGGNVDEDLFNNEFFKDGAGLSPVKAGEIRGDEKREEWVFLAPGEERHPVLRLFEGENNPLIQGVKVFRWWNTSVDQVSAEQGATRILGTWTDEEASPALVEKSFGEGRVITFSTPLDLDWNDWAQDAPSYLITLQETARYLSQSIQGNGVLAAGEPIRMPLDLTRYRADYEVKPPEGEVRNMLAIRPGGGDDPASSLEPWKIEIDGTRQRGFYEVALTPATQPEPEIVLYAANLNPAEGNLGTVDPSVVQAAMGEAAVTVVSGTSLASLGANMAKMELWRIILYILFGLLVLELFYGWWLGVKRGA